MITAITSWSNSVFFLFYPFLKHFLHIMLKIHSYIVFPDELNQEKTSHLCYPKGRNKRSCDIPQNEAADLLCRFRWRRRFPVPWADDPPRRAQELLCLSPGPEFLCLCYAMHPGLSREPLYRELKRGSLAWQPRMFTREILTD